MRAGNKLQDLGAIVCEMSSKNIKTITLQKNIKDAYIQI